VGSGWIWHSDVLLLLRRYLRMYLLLQTENACC